MYSVPADWLLAIAVLAVTSLFVAGPAAVDGTAAAPSSASADPVASHADAVTADITIDRCHVPSDRTGTAGRAGLVEQVRGYWYIPG